MDTVARLIFSVSLLLTALPPAHAQSITDSPILDYAQQLKQEGISELSLTGNERLSLAQALAGCSGVWQFEALDRPQGEREVYLEDAIGAREVAVLLALPVLGEEGLVDDLAEYEQIAFDGLKADEQGEALGKARVFCGELGDAKDEALRGYWAEHEGE